MSESDFILGVIGLSIFLLIIFGGVQVKTCNRESDCCNCLKEPTLEERAESFCKANGAEIGNFKQILGDTPRFKCCTQTL